MELEGVCPVCETGFSFEIDDPDAGSQTHECGCGVSLDVSYSVTVEVDDVEVIGGVTAELECPRCHSHESLEITEESGDEEIECSCGVTLSVSWSSWGHEIEAEAISAAIEYDCPCGDSSSFNVTEESGEEEVECGSCEATLSVSWSDWGERVDVQVHDEPDDDDDDDDDDEEEDDEEGEEEDDDW